MDFSPETLRTRWSELTAVREAADAELEPRWSELESIVSGTFQGSLEVAKARENLLRAEIRQLQEGLFPVEQERASIARALNGKTG